MSRASDHRTSHGARRAFHPATTSVTVQAIYDAESIAILVRWHDMSAQKTGKNAPSLPVPPEEEEAAPAAQAQSAEQAAADPLPRSRRRRADQPSEFSDAVAIQIPTQAPTDARKPYFIFGDGQASVDLWFFNLAESDPLQFIGSEVRISRPTTHGM